MAPQAIPTRTRDIKTHGSRDRARPKYSFHYASPTDRDRVYALIQTYQTLPVSGLLNPHPAASAASSPSGTLSPLESSPRGRGGRKSRKALFATSPVREGEREGQGEWPDGTPCVSQVSLSLPHSPVVALPCISASQVMPLPGDFGPKGLTLPAISEQTTTKGSSTSILSRLFSRCTSLSSKSERDRDSGPRMVPLWVVSVSALLLLCLSLLGGAGVTVVLMRFAASTVSASHMDAESLTSEDISATGISAGSIEVDTLSSAEGSVTVQSDLDVPSVFTLTNSPSASVQSHSSPGPLVSVSKGVSGDGCSSDSSAEATSHVGGQDCSAPLDSCSAYYTKDTTLGVSSITMDGGSLSFTSDTVAFSSDPVQGRGIAPSSVDTTSLTAESATIYSGSIDNTVVGANAPAAGSFSTLSVGSYSLPSADGAVGQVLSTDGQGSLTWLDASEPASHVSTITAPSGSGLTLSADTSVSITGTEGVAVTGATLSLDAVDAVTLSAGDLSLTVSTEGVVVSDSLYVTGDTLEVSALEQVAMGVSGVDTAPLSLSSATDTNGVSSISLDGGAALLSADTLTLGVSSVDASAATVSLDSVSATSLSVSDSVFVGGTLSAPSVSLSEALSVGTGGIHTDGPITGDTLSLDATTSLLVGTADTSGPVSLSHPGATTSVLGDISVSGITSLGSTLSVSTIDASGDLTIGGGSTTSISLGSAVTASDTLSVVGTLSAQAGIETSVVHSSDTLTLRGGDTGASINLGAGTSSLSAADSVSISTGTTEMTVTPTGVAVTGAVPLSSTLEVSGAIEATSVSVGSIMPRSGASVSVNGDMAVSGDLTTSGAVAVGAGLTVAGDLTLEAD
eukprot:g5020.t1